MNKERKEWCEKYEVNIADNGFIDKFCMPEHVQYVLPSPSKHEKKGHFIGFDGKAKTYEQLTEEEKQDYHEQQAKIPERFNEFLNSKNIGKEPGE